MCVYYIHTHTHTYKYTSVGVLCIERWTCLINQISPPVNIPRTFRWLLKYAFVSFPGVYDILLLFLAKVKDPYQSVHAVWVLLLFTAVQRHSPDRLPCVSRHVHIDCYTLQETDWKVAGIHCMIIHNWSVYSGYCKHVCTGIKMCLKL